MLLQAYFILLRINKFQSEIIVDQSALKTIMQNSSPFGAVSLLIVGEFLQLPAVTKKVGSWNQVRDHIGHSMGCCGKKSNCMSWLRLFGKAVTQILLN